MGLNHYYNPCTADKIDYLLTVTAINRRKNKMVFPLLENHSKKEKVSTYTL